MIGKIMVCQQGILPISNPTVEALGPVLVIYLIRDA